VILLCIALTFLFCLQTPLCELLEHEAIATADVVVFASLFLVGFAVLASFLRKLSSNEELKDKPSFADILRETGCLCGTKQETAEDNGN
jgi:hypothetical protein